MTSTNSPGLNNGLDYYEFFLDSSEYSNANDLLITPLNWPNFLLNTNKQLKGVAAMKVVEVQLRVSWHELTTKMVSGGFTTSKVTFTDTALGTTTGIVLTVGSYTPTQFATELQTGINNAATTLGSPNTYTVAYSGITGNFTITRTAGANGWRISVAADATYYNSWHWKAGMVAGYVSAISAGSLTLPNHTCAPTYLYICSTKLAPLFNAYLPPGRVQFGLGGTKGAQIAKIPINAAKGDVIHWQDPDPEKWFNFDNAPTITAADFYCMIGPSTDPTDMIDFNGCPFSIKLGALLYTENSTVNYPSGAMAIRTPMMF